MHKSLILDQSNVWEFCLDMNKMKVAANRGGLGYPYEHTQGQSFKSSVPTVRTRFSKGFMC